MQTQRLTLASEQAMLTEFVSIGQEIINADAWSIVAQWELPVASISAVDVTVRLATTAALPACTASGGTGIGHILQANANGSLSVDGTLVAGDILLVQNQVDKSDNGIYTMGAAGSDDPGGTQWSMIRHTDWDESTDIFPGMVVEATAGVVNAGVKFILGGAIASPSIDVNDLVFTTPVPTGTFGLEVSNDSLDGIGGFWIPIDIDPDTQPSGSADGFPVSFTDFFGMVRVRYTPTSGDGVCRVALAYRIT